MTAVILVIGGLLFLCIPEVLSADRPQLRRSFAVDYGSSTFVKDGRPFRYISGSIHYSRVPSSEWSDRLMKMKSAGLDTVQTYVMWNFHEPTPGQYDFTGDRDLERFIQAVRDLDLLLIVRAGPYVCAEWEFGGLPWFLARSDIKVRTSDLLYLKYVDTWLDILLPKLTPYLYANGGPIITVQYENEYGSYGVCDHGYMSHLLKKFRQHLGDEVVLFTTDGPGEHYLECGAEPNDSLATIDFGITPDPMSHFEVQQKFQPGAPLVNSEFYSGWLDHWGENFAVVDGRKFAGGLQRVLSVNASVNIYMMAGGSNSGYWSGANADSRSLHFSITSYDYDSPISESGDTTGKFFLMREVIRQVKQAPPPPVPENSTKTFLSDVQLSYRGDLLSFTEAFSSPKTSAYPLNMEAMKAGYGLVLYSHIINEGGTHLQFPANVVRDRANIVICNPVTTACESLASVDNKLDSAVTVDLPEYTTIGWSLNILTENRGRVNFNSQMQDQRKGIVGNVTLDGKSLSGWSMRSLDLTLLPGLIKNEVEEIGLPFPSVYHARVQLPEAADTFLNLTCFTSGYALVNQVNLGRFLPVEGPQQTLFVSKQWMHGSPVFNLTIVELDRLQAHCKYPRVDFLSYPILDARVTGHESQCVL